MTECTPGQLSFSSLGRREIVAKFDGGTISSDGGALLLKVVDERLGLTEALAKCFTDHRRQELVEHSVQTLLRQRVMGIALGYEDLNDHDELRRDPLLATAAGVVDVQGEGRKQARDRGCALAGKSTLNRLELGARDGGPRDRYRRIVADPAALDRLLVSLFVSAYRDAPEQIVLDVDATDDPVHGEQEGRFFHGYYGHYCYLPLYVFCGEHLLCARLREANQDAAAGVVEELDKIVTQIRKTWPKVQIIVRGDSGFCRDGLMSWCEENQVDYVLGLAKNARLIRAIGGELDTARKQHEETGRAARVFRSLTYRTRKSWSRERRVIGKAEHLARGSNPRFIVTTLPVGDDRGRSLYEDLYCARGDMENRIKEQQLDLFADRTSCTSMKANQLRLYFASFAYCLMQGLRRLGLEGTEYARAQCGTLRLKLFKVGAQIKISARKIWVSLSESYPYRDLFTEVHRRLHGPPVPLR
jgi:hypothetical protein